MPPFCPEREVILHLCIISFKYPSHSNVIRWNVCPWCLYTLKYHRCHKFTAQPHVGTNNVTQHSWIYISDVLSGLNLLKHFHVINVHAALTWYTSNCFTPSGPGTSRRQLRVYTCTCILNEHLNFDRMSTGYYGMVSYHQFTWRAWFCAVRPNLYPGLCRHMASLDHHELNNVRVFVYIMYYCTCVCMSLWGVKEACTRYPLWGSLSHNTEELDRQMFVYDSMLLR